MSCLETCKSVVHHTTVRFLCDATGGLKMQELAKLLHLCHCRSCICLITGECATTFMDTYK